MAAASLDSADSISTTAAASSRTGVSHEPEPEPEHERAAAAAASAAAGAAVLIDFELGGLNYRGFDLCKLFRNDAGAIDTSNDGPLCTFLQEYRCGRTFFEPLFC